MAATDVSELFGGTVERGGADGAAWSVVAKVKSVTVPKMEKNIRDRTTLDSTGGYKEFGEGGLRDPGQFEVQCLYTSQGAIDARADEARKAGTHYRITLENGDLIQFKSLVTVDIQLPFDEDGMIVLAGQSTGPVTFTPAA